MSTLDTHQLQREGTPALFEPFAALYSLLARIETCTLDFARDTNSDIQPYIKAAVDESLKYSKSSDKKSLEDFMTLHGWNRKAESLSLPVDARTFASRLKAYFYDNLVLVGSGTYSYVYRAQNKLDGTTITLKKLRIDCDGEGLPNTAIREISLLRDLEESPHIVKLLDILWDGSKVYLVMEYLDLDLAQYLAMREMPLPSEMTRNFLWQLLQGVAAAHSKRVIHRDLKPQNILIDRTTNTLKVADFGLARTYSIGNTRPYTHEVVTLLYRAPELLLGSPIYSAPVDMWSVGCIFAEMVLGSPLFKGDSEIGQLYQIFRLLGTPEATSCCASFPDWQPLFPQWRARDLATVLPGLCPEGVDLLRKMFHYDPNSRITASDALMHSYFHSAADA